MDNDLLDNLDINQIPDLNIFMMCEKLNRKAISKLSKDFYVRNIRKEELDIWKAFPFDTVNDAIKYDAFMSEYFDTVYASKADLFYQKCLFVCDKFDRPIATCFIWKAYNQFNTIHWFKTIKEYEGAGIGRALLSIVMQEVKEEEYPIFLHTQPSSYKAIKLYSDFGFVIVTDPYYGERKNDIEECLPILKKFMPRQEYKKLQFKKAPNHFRQVVDLATTNQF